MIKLLRRCALGLRSSLHGLVTTGQRSVLDPHSCCCSHGGVLPRRKRGGIVLCQHGLAPKHILGYSQPTHIAALLGLKKMHGRITGIYFVFPAGAIFSLWPSFGKQSLRPVNQAQIQLIG